ncbi:MAG: GNAT family N-acetyltransferase [Clostridia bacterium]|nr:GNAT family N-acetyltransferase [Clostridia bacterium]
MLYLKALNPADARKEYDFFQQMPSENGFMNPYHGISYEEFCTVAIPHRLAASRGEDLEPGHVPDTYYFLWHGDEIVGQFKLRPVLNDFLRTGSGHVGYGIHPAHRRKGYATEGLRLTIELLKTLPEFQDSEVYFSCNLDNEGSLKTMLNNGGYIHHSDGEHHYVRIKV